jgi:hypothetical protein
MQIQNSKKRKGKILPTAPVSDPEPTYRLSFFYFCLCRSGERRTNPTLFKSFPNQGLESQLFLLFGPGVGCSTYPVDTSIAHCKSRLHPQSPLSRFRQGLVFRSCHSSFLHIPSLQKTSPSSRIVLNTIANINLYLIHLLFVPNFAILFPSQFSFTLL